jgi:uncharacterized protein (TIRG00374 family)
MPTEQPRSQSRFPWHTVFILLLTAGLLWLFIRSIDLGEVASAIGRANLWLLSAAVGVTMITYVVRAIRWQILLQPIGHVPFRTAFRTTVIGFAAIFLLPGRVGEILRPYLAARREGLNATAAFATVVFERVLDLFTVLLLFAGAIVFARADVGRDVQAAGIVVGVVALAAFALLALGAGHPERLGRWAGVLTGWLPARLGARIATLVRTFAEGLAVLRSPGRLAAAGLWSLPLWTSIAVGIWLTTKAFGLSLPFVGSFLVVGYLAVGVALPTPGGAGGFHYFYLLAMTQLFAADRSTAGAAALILHAVSFVPVTLLGLLFMWQDGLSLGRLRHLRAEAGEVKSS